ncbi:MAG: O-antigen ligase family protein [Candidatus Sumerlaeia bacterium]|nr:O-antigen ligase family protein [Candidatus Sumerlaeia bacterium]
MRVPRAITGAGLLRYWTPRVAIAALAAALLYLFNWGGTPYSKILYPAAFCVGLLRPVWALYAIALFGPLFLNDPGNTHLLVTLEVFLLGAFSGYVRLRSIDGLGAAGDAPPGSPAGPWPAWAASMAMLVGASAIVGARLVLLREDAFAGREDTVFATAMNVFYGWSTMPDWGLRALWNWWTAILAAFLAARFATPLVAARWLKLAGLGLAAACAAAFLDRFGLIDLDTFRRPNPDPLHAGRLQGLGGHAGWFGMWIVACWPGLALWLAVPSRKFRLVIASVLLFLVAPALILTAARASWLGVGLGVALGAAYLYRRERAVRPWMFIGVALAAALFAVAALFSDVVSRRIENLLRVGDRLNYYSSGATMLREYPFGTGLGTHYLYYESLFLPWPVSAHYQFDHVSAHSYPLQILIENGPAALALLLLGGLLLARDLRRAWPRLAPDPQRTALALLCSVGGLLVVGVAQYLGDIRVIELTLWVGAGLLAGLLRRGAPDAFAAESPRTAARAILAASAVAAFATASANLSRPITGQYPRAAEWHPETAGWQIWTDRVWRFPVDPDVSEVRFSAYRKHAPATVTVRWPDGHEETATIGPEGQHSFARTLEHGAPSRFAPRRWLEVRVDSTFAPRDYDPESTDYRRLGVFIWGFMMERAPAQGT